MFNSIVTDGAGQGIFWIGMLVFFLGAMLLGTYLINMNSLDKDDKKLFPLSIIILVIGGFILLGLSCYIAPVHPDYQYYLPAEFYGTMKDNNTWLFIDEEGNIWEWEDSTKSYNNDTVYLLTMDDNGTPENVEDDIILMVWAEGGEEISWG